MAKKNSAQGKGKSKVDKPAPGTILMRDSSNIELMWYANNHIDQLVFKLTCAVGVKNCNKVLHEIERLIRNKRLKDQKDNKK